MQLHVQLNDFLHMSILKANHLMTHGILAHLTFII
jgi:hypothetical protein